MAALYRVVKRTLSGKQIIRQAITEPLDRAEAELIMERENKLSPDIRFTWYTRDKVKGVSHG